ncbi:hypothetical protein MRX96_044942 [Rhipicephalus microplus]
MMTEEYVAIFEAVDETNKREDDRSRNSKTGSRDMVDMVLLSKKLHSSFDETNAKSFYPSPPRLTQCQQQSQQQCLSAAQSAGQLASVGQEFDDANSDCDSVPSNGGGEGQHRHHHTYDVPFHVRRLYKGSQPTHKHHAKQPALNGETFVKFPAATKRGAIVRDDRRLSIVPPVVGT